MGVGELKVSNLFGDGPIKVAYCAKKKRRKELWMHHN